MTWRTLTEELEHLERTDPDVAAAAAAWDRMVWKVSTGRHKNRRLSDRFRHTADDRSETA